MKALIILGIIIVASAIWIALEVRRAPKGYEDKDGFHEGDEP